MYGALSLSLMDLFFLLIRHLSQFLLRVYVDRFGWPNWRTIRDDKRRQMSFHYHPLRERLTALFRSDVVPFKWQNRRTRTWTNCLATHASREQRIAAPLQGALRTRLFAPRVAHPVASARRLRETGWRHARRLVTSDWVLIILFTSL